ncbi:MAG: DUF5667 domain-containing protein [Minisyncoccota bacterium]
MKNNFEKLIRKAGARVALGEAERAKMRFVLREYAAMKPVRESSAPAMHTPFIGAWLAYLRRPTGIAVAVTLVLTLSSGGLAYAADGALPGDTLYPIKVAVVEPVRVALAASPEAKASLQMTFAERRVDEAATLAIEGKLGTSTEAALAANFIQNADGATAAVTSERAQNPTDADILTTNFAARLAAYQNVLATVGTHSHDQNTTAHFQTIIQTQLSSIATDQVAGEASSTMSRDIPAQKHQNTVSQDALHLQDVADAALRVSADIVDTASSTLDSSSSESAHEELARASALAKQGRALLTQHDEKGATRAFQNSLSATARLDVLTRASAKLDIQAFATTTASTTVEIKTGESPDSGNSNSHPLQTTSPDQEGGDIQFGL